MEKGKIFINGLIGFCGFDANDAPILGVQLVDVIAQVKSQPNATEFDVYIKSDGGNVEEGFRIFRYLETLPQAVNTIGRGRIASIATVIFMSGVNRYLAADCEFMIHLPSGSVRGTAAEIEAYNKTLKSVEAFCVDFYAEKFGLDKETVFALLDSETWLTTGDCIALGIAEEYQQTPVVARADVSDKTKKFL